MFDYIVAGCGLSGSIIARDLAQKNKKVLILEKRDHIGGNLYDYKDDSGILVQKYGPHIFHTNDVHVWEYVNRFAGWHDFNMRCMVYMQGKFTPSPFNNQTIDDYFTAEEAKEIKENLRIAYKDCEKVTIVDMLNSRNPVVKKYADFLFEHDYCLYTAKQWGIRPDEIDVSVLNRVPVLFSYQNRYFDDKFQAMPEKGYTSFISNILNHKNIVTELNVNAADRLKLDEERRVVLYQGKALPVIWTGALDELFHYCYGRLPYRSLRFVWKTLEQDSYQKAPVVAYPEAEGYTRITEYKKLPVQNIYGKTTIAVEYPLPVNENADAEPYYPVPTKNSQSIYEKYRAKADMYKNMKLCGRLAEYRYYDMDQIIDSALQLCHTIG